MVYPFACWEKLSSAKNVASLLFSNLSIFFSNLKNYKGKFQTVWDVTRHQSLAGYQAVNKGCGKNSQKVEANKQ
jgi:hypothetical protein